MSFVTPITPLAPAAAPSGATPEAGAPVAAGDSFATTLAAATPKPLAALAEHGVAAGDDAGGLALKEAGHAHRGKGKLAAMVVVSPPAQPPAGDQDRDGTTASLPHVAGGCPQLPGLDLEGGAAVRASGEVRSKMLEALAASLPEVAGEATVVALNTPVQLPSVPLANAESVGRAGAEMGKGRQLLPAAAVNLAAKGADEAPATPALSPELADTGWAAQSDRSPGPQLLSVLASGGIELSSTASQAAGGAPLQAHEMTALLARAGSPANAPAPAGAQIAVPFAGPGWTEAFAEKLVWAATRQGQVAELLLNPPSLGSIEVRLSLHGGEAEAQFFSPHAAVRDTLESALPRLREMLAAAGLSLGDAMVSEHPFTQRDANGGASPGSAEGGTTSPPGPALARIPIKADGLLDLYI